MGPNFPDSIEQPGIQLQDLNADEMSQDFDMSDIDSLTSSTLRIIDETNEYYINNSDRSLKFKIKRFFYLAWNGPLEPKDEPPTLLSFLQPIDHLPKRIRAHVSTKYQVCILIVYIMSWILLQRLILIPYLTQLPTNAEHNVEVRQLSCDSSFWRGKNAECGLNGELCEPFDNHEVIFRCPALCDSGIFSLMPVGDQLIKYRGYFIGGGQTEETDILSKPYRSDSFPCQAAVHSGLLSPVFGGCARISYEGSQSSFPSTPGHYRVSNSIDFNSFFPSSYIFKKLPGSISNCYDPRILILFVNVVLGAPIMFFATGLVSFWVITVMGFWTVVLATDPPRIVEGGNVASFASLVSLGLERFLPLCFILYVLWHITVRRTFTDTKVKLSSPLCKLLLWYPLLWIGLLNNFTFDKLPTDRLTIKDLKAQPGALIAVPTIISVVLGCAIIQAYKLWQSGRFKKYLCIYGLFVGGLIFLGNLPGLTLRLHHYILALVLLPGCATRGLTAYIFQGVLVGLFISGSGRWGMAAIAETAEALRRSDPTGEIKPPVFTGYDSTTGILSWIDVDSDKKSRMDGYSLLVNDLERYRGETASVNFAELVKNDVSLEEMINRTLVEIADKNGDIPIYLRVGKTVLDKSDYSDFTNAGVLRWPSGAFEAPSPGITR